MQYRTLGRTDWKVSTVSFGAWAVGGTWGPVDDEESMAALHRAVDDGVTLFDTADVYGDGHSEKLLGRLRRERKEPFHIATKAGKRLDPFTVEGFNKKNLNTFVDRSRKNLGTETIDLLQLHCPPQDIYYKPDVFEILDDMVAAGKIRFYGVSVERVEEALKAIDFPGVQSVQIIYNIYRQRPAEVLFHEARKRRVGILARLDDHRNYNRNGESFDRGETFSGIPFEVGLDAVEELRPLVPAGSNLAAMALRWILMNEAVTCVIPGGKRPAQVDENCAAADLAPLSAETMAKIQEIYDRRIKKYVHPYW
jgi:aryl-alcohol dehydrogenase-like predicted oxidoreductase